LVRRLVGILVILLLTIGPSYGGGGDDDDDSGGGCGGGGGGGGGGGAPPPGIASEAFADYSTTPITIASGTYTETINGGDFINQLLGDASNRFDPRLPGYSYFQGVIQAENHITVAGQVRIVGGLLGTDRADATASLYSGAMITTNAHGIVGAGSSLTGGPPGMRTRIRTMEEIPTP
jgi:hypothetical protein